MGRFTPSNPIRRVTKFMKKEWGKAYRQLWARTQNTEKRHPTKEEQEIVFKKLCKEYRIYVNSIVDLPECQFLALMKTVRHKYKNPKTKQVVDLSQMDIGLNFEEKPKTSSRLKKNDYIEEMNIFSGKYASKNTKDYGKEVWRRR